MAQSYDTPRDLFPANFGYRDVIGTTSGVELSTSVPRRTGKAWHYPAAYHTGIRGPVLLYSGRSDQGLEVNVAVGRAHRLMPVADAFHVIVAEALFDKSSAVPTLLESSAMVLPGDDNPEGMLPFAERTGRLAAIALLGSQQFNLPGAVLLQRSDNQ